MSKAEKASRKSRRRKSPPLPPRRPHADPATSVFMQLAALIGILFGRLPVLPRRSWSRLANAYEKGEGGKVPMPTRRQSHGRYQARPTYRQLIADLRRPAARRDAEEVLRRRVPAEVLPWLDDVIAREDWWALGTVARVGVPDDVVETRMMQESLEWLRRLQPDEPGSLPAMPDEDREAAPRF